MDATGGAAFAWPEPPTVPLLDRTRRQRAEHVALGLSTTGRHGSALDPATRIPAAQLVNTGPYVGTARHARRKIAPEGASGKSGKDL